MEIRVHPFRSMHHARSILMYDVIVFENLHFCPSTRKREASVFKNHTVESVFGDCFQWIRVYGRPNRRKKIPFFKQKWICVDAWRLYVATVNWVQLAYHFNLP